MLKFFTPLALIFTLAACGGGSDSSSGDSAASPEAKGTTIEQMVTKCEMENAGGVEEYSVGDGGTSIQLNGDGEEEFGMSAEQIGCAFANADVPDHVISQVEATRALDGMQEAEWDGWTMRWNYHPDGGLTVILVEE